MPLSKMLMSKVTGMDGKVYCLLVLALLVELEALLIELVNLLLDILRHKPPP
jgi:hypothetical protein